jgi:hypothetical protein
VHPYQRLLSYVRPYWWAFALALIGTIIVAAGDVLMAYMVMPIVQNLQHPNPETTLELPLAVVAVFLLRGVGSFMSEYGMAWTGYRVVFDLRKRMIDQLLVLPTPYYDTHSLGKLISKVTFDAYQLAGATSSATSPAQLHTSTVKKSAAANTCQCAFKNTDQDIPLPRSGQVRCPLWGGFDAVRFQNSANGPSAQLVPEIRHGAPDPRVAPAAILLRHAQHQRNKFCPDARPTRATSLNERPFPCHQLAVPAKQRLRRNDRAKLVQCFAPQRPRLLRKLSAFGVSEDDAPSTKPRAKHAILDFQIVDRRRLLPLQPTSDHHQQELEKGCRASHQNQSWPLSLITSR